MLADGAGGGHAQVGIDIYLAHAVFDSFDDFRNRHAVGLRNVSAVFVDDTLDEIIVTNPSGQLQGGFITFDLDGDGFGDADVFLLPVTPALEDPFDLGIGELTDGAHNSGPGDDPCDGIGIDDLEACFGP